MWEAIHKKTRKAYWSDQCEVEFNDPHDEEWVCCPLDSKPVEYVKQHPRTINGKEIIIPAFFRMEKGASGSCISFSNESEQHKKLKILVATLLENKRIKLQVSDSVIEWDELKIRNVKRLPFRWEQQKEKRRADVLFEFERWHPLLGKGIVFEIVVSEDMKSIDEKRVDWNENGYSFTFLNLDMFEERTLKEKYIKIFDPWLITIYKNLRFETERLRDLINQKERLLKKTKNLYKTCRTCKHSSKTKPGYGDPATYTCWYSRNVNGQKRPNGHVEPTYTCEQWEPETVIDEIKVSATW